MKYLFLSLIVYITSYATIIYNGDINGSKVSLFLDDREGVYIYNKYKVPIPLEIEKDKEKLILKSNDEIFYFENYDKKKDKIRGKWKKGDKELLVNLEKRLDTDFSLGIDKIIEIPMFRSTKNEYFWVKISKDEKNRWSRTFVDEILIYDKKTKKILQKIDTKDEEFNTFIGIKSLDIGDYNFDGVIDFSMFGSFFTGPNTISNYFLKNKKNGKYELAESYSYTSLSFDEKEKKVYSESSSGAGQYRDTVTFIVEGNILIPIEKSSLEISDDGEIEVIISYALDARGEWIETKRTTNHFKD